METNKVNEIVIEIGIYRIEYQPRLLYCQYSNIYTERPRGSITIYMISRDSFLCIYWFNTMVQGICKYLMLCQRKYYLVLCNNKSMGMRKIYVQQRVGCASLRTIIIVLTEYRLVPLSFTTSNSY